MGADGAGVVIRRGVEALVALAVVPDACVGAEGPIGPVDVLEVLGGGDGEVEVVRLGRWGRHG